MDIDRQMKFSRRMHPPQRGRAAKVNIVYIYIYRERDTSIYLYTCMHMYMYIHIYMYIYIDMLIHRYIDIHIYIQIDRYKHIQIKIDRQIDYRQMDTQIQIQIQICWRRMHPPQRERRCWRPRRRYLLYLYLYRESEINLYIYMNWLIKEATSTQETRKARRAVKRKRLCARIDILQIYSNKWFDKPHNVYLQIRHRAIHLNKDMYNVLYLCVFLYLYIYIHICIYI